MPRLLESQWEEIKEVFDEEGWADKTGIKRNFHKRIVELMPHLDIGMDGLYKKVKQWIEGKTQKKFIQSINQSKQKQKSKQSNSKQVNKKVNKAEIIKVEPVNKGSHYIKKKEVTELLDRANLKIEVFEYLMNRMEEVKDNNIKRDNAKGRIIDLLLELYENMLIKVKELVKDAGSGFISDGLIKQFNFLSKSIQTLDPNGYYSGMIDDAKKLGLLNTEQKPDITININDSKEKPEEEKEVIEALNKFKENKHVKDV